jgi:hypothetical protein
VGAPGQANVVVAVPGVQTGDVMLPIIVNTETGPLYVDGVGDSPGSLTLSVTNFTAAPYAGGDAETLSALIIRHTGSI